MEYPNDFELVDNVALLAQRRYDMQSKFDDPTNHSLAAGLTINANKNKSLDVNTINSSSFSVAGQEWILLKIAGYVRTSLKLFSLMGLLRCHVSEYSQHGSTPRSSLT